jgi:alpha-L-fucosidase
MDSQDRTSADKMSGAVPKPDDFEPWEACMTINNSWAYKPKDRNFKSTDTLIRSLIEIISRGGNLLLDVGPQPDGQIQPEFVERLNAIGEWTTLNSSAIYGSTYGPIQNQDAYRTTARGASVFVFVMDPSATEVTVSSINRPVHQVRLVATGKPINFHSNGNGIRVPVDKTFWAQGIPVLELR